MLLPLLGTALLYVTTSKATLGEFRSGPARLGLGVSVVAGTVALSLYGLTSL